jgi:polysaccharide biosynthesis protein PslL
MTQCSLQPITRNAKFPSPISIENRAGHRVDWVDLLKGLGIICVVAGHVFHGLVSAAFFEFHIPLFFFISGYLATPKPEYKKFFLKKVEHLIIPYLAFLIIFFVPNLFTFSNHPNGHLITKKFIEAIYGGAYLTGWLSIFWFVTCLFFTQQIANYLLTQFTQRTVAFIAGLALVAAYLYSSFAKGLNTPWAVDVVLAAFPIYYVGFRLKNFTITSNAVVAAAFIVGISIIGLVYGVPLPVDMKHSNYGIPLISFGVAASWIILLIAISMYISKFDFLKKMLIRCGVLSMGIMFLHQGIQLVLDVYVGIHDDLARFIMTIVVSFLISETLYRFPVPRRILLGVRPA